METRVNSQVALTTALAVFDEQCGGKNLFLARGEGRVLKPYSEREYRFYEWLNGPEFHPGKKGMLRIVPKYYGTTSVDPRGLDVSSNSEWVKHLVSDKYSIQSNKEHYLVLENLLEGMQQPCSVDFKIGTGSKKKFNTPKYAKSTTYTHHFRMCGAKVYQPSRNTTVFKDKYYHQQVGPDQIELNLAHFFFDGKEVNGKRILKTVDRIGEVIESFKAVTGVEIDSLSLLVAYDGSNPESKVVAKLIDYDNSIFHGDESVDEDRLKGLSNLSQCLLQVLHKQTQLVDLIKLRSDL